LYFAVRQLDLMNQSLASRRGFYPASPIDAAAAVVALLAGLVALGNAIVLREDLGTVGWRPGSALFCLIAAAYLLITALDHWRRDASPAPRAEPWLSILILVLGWFVLARGPASRLLLAGLGPTVAALSAAGGVSLLVALRERLILARPATDEPKGRSLAAWRCALAAAVLAGFVFLETRPLPLIKPWEGRPPASRAGA
jgi:hypothetical protein